MAWDLEGLIGDLLVVISCGGEKGCTVEALIEGIRQLLTAKPATAYEVHGEEVDTTQDDNPTRFKAIAAIWQWLFSRQDVSLGPNRKYNHLSLSEIIAQSSARETPVVTDGQGSSTVDAAEASSSMPSVSEQKCLFPDDMRALLATDTMWECLTGHGVDYNRVPKSEWELLQGIASTKHKGILQGDLCRLTGQDKRSVPKRTDGLVRKGYITKRTVLVRGTKTSNLWLNRFVPSFLEQKEKKQQHSTTGMDLDSKILTANRDPVPWHYRWTGDTIDYVALAITVVAIVKSWGVIRVMDLKIKLGVMDQLWHLKVVSKTLRLLHTRGVMQFVGAKLGDKLFKDCLKFVRDIDDSDWEAYLAVGKKRSAEDPLDAMDSNGNIDPDRLAAQPPWSLDEPLHTYIARTARSLTGSQLSNSDIFTLSAGASFTRFLTNTALSMAESTVQPHRLKHYQLQNEQTRNGKVASYKYWMHSNPSDTDSIEPGSLINGFSALPAKPNMANTADLSVLCRPNRTLSKPTRGTHKLERVLGSGRTAIADESGDEATQGSAGPRQRVVTLEVDSGALRSPAQSSDSGNPNDPGQTSDLGPIHIERSTHENQRASQVTGTEKDSTDTTDDDSAKKAKESQRALAQVKESSLQDVGSIEVIPATEGAASIAHHELPSTNVSDPFEGEEKGTQGRRGRAPRGSGRGRGRGRGRGKGRGGTSSSDGKPWKCEKCGGAWKNDIGLKYHLEKARVACNPDFDPETSVRRGGKLRAFLEKRTSTTKAPSQQESASKETHSNVGSPRSKHNGRKDNMPLSEDDELVALRPRREKTKRTNCSQKISGSRRLTPLHTSQPKSDRLSTPGRGALLPTMARRTVRAADIIDTTTSQTGMGFVAHPTRMDDMGDFGLLSKSSEARLERDSESNDLFKRETEMLSRDLVHHNAAEPLINSPARGLSQTALAKENKRRVEKLLLPIFAESDGCFPGGDALWRALRVAWVQEYPNEHCPTNRAFTGMVASLVRAKVIAEHCHAFRAPNGSFANVKIMSLPAEDPFSLKARELLTKVKSAYPDVWLPNYIREAETLGLRVKGELVKSKRALPTELVELDAPVYAEQIATKRKLEEERARDGYPKGGGRKRQRIIIDHVDGRSENRGDTVGMYRFRSSSARNTPVDVQQMANFSQNNILHFLEPNTALEDGEIKPPSNIGALGKRVRAEERKALIKPQLFDKYGLQQQTHITAQKNPSDGAKIVPPYSISSSKRDQWPDLDVRFFEDCDGSFTLQSQDWFPNQDWFSWCSINQAIDKTATAQGSRGWFRVNEKDSNWRRFKDRLVAAARVEMAWGDAFLTARPGAAGPHNIFIPFWGSAVETGHIGGYSWPKEGQYSQKHHAAIVDAAWDEEPSDDDSEFEEAVNVRLRRRKVYTRGSRKLKSHGRQQKQALAKSVVLKKRKMTTIPEDVAKQAGGSWGTWDTPAPGNPEELLAGIIAVRSLMGGIDRSIDWGLLVHLFPDLSLEVIRRFWKQARKSQRSYILELTRSFREGYITACEAEELPILNFDDPEAYDWDRLIKWTMQVPSRPDTQMPNTVCELNDCFTLEDVATSTDNWRERFFHFQTSAHTRMELSSADPSAVPIDKADQENDMGMDIDKISRSWIRSLCCTGETDYAPEIIKKKLLTLAGGDATRVHALLEKALTHLTSEKVIHSKRGADAFDSKPYRLTEPYLSNLNKLAHWDNYKQAAEFKTQLDTAFRAGQSFDIPYTITDGAMMALLNLNAHARIQLKGVGIPHIPFGFQPGKYESRKFDKKSYHFELEAIPTATYQFNEDIPTVAGAMSAEPPTEGPDGALPRWVDFFGRYDINRWTEILAAVCIAYSTRGHMPVETLCQHLRPIVEDFEAKMVIEWGRNIGVFEVIAHESVTVGEWWWLAVPMMRQHPAF